MNGREFLTKVFNREKVERIAIAPFIHSNFVYEFFDNTTVDLAEKEIEVHEFFGFDPIIRSVQSFETIDQNSSAENWDVNIKYETRNDTVFELTTIRTPERELRQIKTRNQNSKYLKVEAITEFFIKDVKDFEQFAKYMPEPYLDCTNIRRARSIVGDRGLLLCFICGTFNALNLYRKLDDLMIDPYMDNAFFQDMADFFMIRQLKACDELIKAGADIINVAGNVANGTMAGPEFFKQYVLENDKKVFEHIKAKGAFSMMHNCGDARSLLNLYSQLGMDCYESLTAPPYGDTILEEAIQAFDKDIILMGHLDQIDFLKNASPDEIKSKVMEIVHIVKNRGNFILGTSDFLFENTPYENIKAFVQAGLEYGKY